MAESQKTLTEDEIDALVAGPLDNECQVLCELLQDTIADLATATGRDRVLDFALIRSLRGRMKLLHCKPCLPQ